MKEILSTAPGQGYKELGRVLCSTPDEIIAAVTGAKKAFPLWQETSLDERKRYVSKIYERLITRREEIADLIVLEAGHTRASIGPRMDRDFEKVKWCIDNVEAALKPVITYQDANSLHQMIYEPRGVAACISPWNFPLSNCLWALIPNLLVGNTVVFKHSEECILTGKLLDSIIQEAELPEGVYSQVYGAADIGKELLNQDIDLIWFTGSSAAGIEINKKAAEKFIKAILELGGSNPTIVCEDADIDTHLEKIFLKRFANCGQSCDALKRLYVHESRFLELTTKFTELIRTKKFGDNREADTVIGPLASEKQLLLLEAQVQDAIDKGAKVLIGGKRGTLAGAYYEPTLLTGVTPEMRIFTEEVFGPVLPIYSFKTDEEAIRLANDSEYGLGAVVFSEDRVRARHIAAKLHAGTVEITGGNHWLSCNPFGGYKKSGMGREHGLLGFQELCQVKVISE